MTTAAAPLPVPFSPPDIGSARISLTIAAGAGFPNMLMQAACGREVSPAVGRFRDALWMTSFETSVFVPETLIGSSSTPIDRIVPEVA